MMAFLVRFWFDVAAVMVMNWWFYRWFYVCAGLNWVDWLCVTDEIGCDFAELPGGSFVPAVVRSVVVTDGPPPRLLPQRLRRSTHPSVRSAVHRIAGWFLCFKTKDELANQMVLAEWSCWR